MPTSPETDRPSYRVQLAASLAALVHVWWTPAFRDDLVRTTTTDLGTTEARTLWELGLGGPRRPSVLAATLDLGAPAATKVVARLARRGLVQTALDPHDARAVLVSLTEQGRATTEDLYAVGDRMVTEILADWPEEDARALTALTARFTGEALRFAARLHHRAPLRGDI